jgi:23S rRNA (guanosine2251-2'-O)-methyltransferase
MRTRARDGQSARANRHAATGAASEQRIAHLDEEGLYRKVAQAGQGALVLVLDGVKDPHNLGACLRTADAAGALAVLVPKDRACPVTETVVRVACGAAAVVPVVRATNLARALKRLQEAGLWLVGTADEVEVSLYEIDFTGPIGLVMGAEEKGLRRLTREGCDHLVRIPMAGSVDCLNVSVAAGVCLFEALRQRAAGDSFAPG